MRIVHAVRSDAFAGVERHVAVLARAQVALGHEVHVVGGSPERMRAVLPDQVAVVAAATTRQVLRAVRRLRDDVDLVHAHMTAAEVASAVAVRSPLVVTRHFAARRGTGVRGGVAALAVRTRVSAQLAVSEYVANAVEGRSLVVYPGVEAPLAPSQEPRERVVLVVQRLEREKSTDVALRAFAAGAPSTWTLVVVGEGSQLDDLRSLAATLDISGRTSFVGFRHDVGELMSRSAVLLAPCEVEGLGLSVLEAMAHALPVVASRAGAHPETVGRAEGAQLFDPGSWRHAGEMLRGLSASPAMRAAYGPALRRAQQETFTPETQARATDAVYQAVLA